MSLRSTLANVWARFQGGFFAGTCRGGWPAARRGRRDRSDPFRSTLRHAGTLVAPERCAPNRIKIDGTSPWNGFRSHVRAQGQS